MFQCDHDHQMQLFEGEFCSQLNSRDLHDSDLPLSTYRAHGGTMIMWAKDLDPHVKVLKVISSSFLPIVFEPPDR